MPTRTSLTPCGSSPRTTGSWHFACAETSTSSSRRSCSTRPRTALGAHAHIVVDLSDATFIDSSAIHALLKINAAANREGCVTVLQLGASATVERAIEIAGIERVLPRAETRSEAIATIRRLASAEVG